MYTTPDYDLLLLQFYVHIVRGGDVTFYFGVLLRFIVGLTAVAGAKRVCRVFCSTGF